MGLRSTLVAAGVGAALAYFLDPKNGKERRARIQKTVEDQLNKRPGLSTGETVQARSTSSTES